MNLREKKIITKIPPYSIAKEERSFMRRGKRPQISVVASIRRSKERGNKEKPSDFILL